MNSLLREKDYQEGSLKKKISKELFELVTNKDVTSDIEVVNSNFQCQIYANFASYEDYAVNTFEIAHNCKIWAYKLGYMVDSKSYKVEIISPLYEFENIHTIYGDSKTTMAYDIDRDIEACQWILDNCINKKYVVEIK